MRINRWASLVLAGGTLAAIAAVPTTANAAAQTLTVTVGGDAGVGGVAFEGMRFNTPPTMTVHKGDTITFEFHGFHTATLIPAGENADDWREENQTGVSGPTSTYSPAIADEDEPGMFKQNNNMVFPSDFNCGAPTAPCDYNGNSVVNSGLPLAATSFTVTVNANPGDTFWVLCLIHPGMQTKITVVPDGDASTAQGAIDSYAASTLAQDQDAAAALLPRLQTQTSHKTSSGKTVWDAYAGYDAPGWSLMGMFPKKLKIEKGDTVRWHFDQLMGEIHSVTFPKSEANKNAAAFGGGDVVCEADPTDTPPDMPPPQFCSSGPQNIEFHIPGSAILPVGTHTYDGTGVHSSGVEGASGISVAPYDLKFKKRTKDGPFKYACNVHGGMMTGKVVVK